MSIIVCLSGARQSFMLGKHFLFNLRSYQSSKSPFKYFFRFINMGQYEKYLFFGTFCPLLSLQLQSDTSRRFRIFSEPLTEGVFNRFKALKVCVTNF